MPTISVRIPQIGEGLQEARLVAVLKQPGDAVKRDEPIYQMETDKAVMDVESPYEGTLVNWLAEVDAILPIGGEVATMEVAEGTEAVAGHGSPDAGSSETQSAPRKAASDGAAGRNLTIPPRTRAYAKEKGLSEADLAAVPVAGSKLMPEDIDAYLGAGGTAAKPAATSAAGPFTEVEMGGKQRLLSSRLVRGAQLVVPGTMTVAANWGPVERLRARIKQSGSDFQPSTFTIFAFAVATALANHPKFRSTMVGDSVIRTYDHASLGIAVALPGDELVLAVVEDADTLDWKTFATTCRERIAEARNGHDQAHEGVTISLTNMQAHNIREAVPVVVPPGVATLFLGESYNGLDSETEEIRLKRLVNLGLTIDHRLINGVGGAEFLNEVRTNVETIDALISL